ncbi:hypothetical protein O7628_13600 [Micromonospora sp. WMMD956]|uniref:ATP-binding protein n=1 Tax=Micromonospora sp. WMMD956 TaxID=3016108 RepID=UPI002416D262|nr:hypothetical protein [Micromonospora sp. WMMD956]MDG4816532.1 hypothetical protein [Micromonospora sp. WMMD956]
MRTSLPITWLPVEDEDPTADRPVAGALHGALTRFLRGLGHHGRLVLTATVSRRPDGHARIDLEVSGGAEAPDTTRRLRHTIGTVVGVGADEPPPVRPSGGRAWQLRPVSPGRFPGFAADAVWPRDGFDWPAVLACVERTPTVTAVTVVLAPVETPEASLPVVARAASRRLDRDPRAEATRHYLTAVEEMRQGVCAAHVSVHADEHGARQVAACLLTTAGRESVTVEVATSRPAGNAMLQLGRFVPVERAAGLLPLVALHDVHPTRFPRRQPPLGSWEPRATGAPSLLLGTTATGDEYRLPIADLAQHLIVTGLPGFGKSTTTMSMLARLWTEHRIPFLVIDPEKDEYAGLIHQLGAAIGQPVSVLRLGRDPVRLNPLAVPDGVAPAAFGATVAEFLDASTHLSESWPLAASVLRAVVAGLYTAPEPPTIAGLYREVRAWAAATPSGARQAAELELSLGARIQSLMSGPNAAALSGGPGAGLDWGRLLSRPALISLAGYADQGSRELAFGLLLAGLVEYRRAHPGTGLTHLAVLEEAHMVLGGGDGQAGTAERGVSAALATLRGYGQGLALVTQTPGQLSRGITELFPNRISHRLAATAAPDAGFTAGPGDQRAVRMLPQLQRGEALVVNAGTQPLPVPVQVTRSPLATPGIALPVTGHPDVVGSGGPQPIWCADCPSPCRGREMLRLLPEARAQLPAAPADLADQAVRLAATLAKRYGIAPRPDPAAKLYCLAARTVTDRLAGDPARLHGVTRAVRDAVDRSLKGPRQ